MAKGKLSNLSGGQHGNDYSGNITDDTSHTSTPFSNMSISKGSGVTTIADGDNVTYTTDSRGAVTSITDDGTS